MNEGVNERANERASEQVNDPDASEHEWVAAFPGPSASLGGRILNKAVSLPALTRAVFLPRASVIPELLPINYSFAQGHPLSVGVTPRKPGTVCHRIKFLIKIRAPLRRGGRRPASRAARPVLSEGHNSSSSVRAPDLQSPGWPLGRHRPVGPGVSG